MLFHNLSLRIKVIIVIKDEEIMESERLISERDLFRTRKAAVILLYFLHESDFY